MGVVESGFWYVEGGIANGVWFVERWGGVFTSAVQREILGF